MGRKIAAVLAALSIAVLAALGSIQPLHAQLMGVLSLGILSEGIVGPTLRTLSAFPDNIANAALKVLNEGLPLIDKRVTDYLNQVDALLEKNMKRAADTLTCTTETVKHQAEEISLRAAFTGGQIRPDPILADFTKQIDKAKMRRRNQQVRDVVQDYDALLLRATAIKCVIDRENTGTVSLEFERQRNRISSQAREWFLLDGPDGDRPLCERIHECAVNRQVVITRLVETSRMEDLKKTGAKELLDSAPKLPNAPSWLAPNFDIRPYEATLARLRQIEFALGAASLARYQDASSIFEAAEQSLRDANGVLQFHENRFSRPQREWLPGWPADAREDGLPKSKAARERAVTLAQKAAAIHDYFANRVPGIQSAAKDAEKRANALEASAANAQKAIDAQVEATRRAREERQDFDRTKPGASSRF